MELKKLDGINKNELSMVEVAHAILEAKNEVLDFNQLLVEIQEYMELSDEALEARMARFYTDLNIDGSFISLGDNRWGLRDWYPIDSIDEEIATSMEDEEVKKPRKKRKKVNAFGTEDDLIDYNDDDPEDENFTPDSDSLEYDDDSEDDEKAEVESYDSELNEIIPDDDLDDVELSEEEDDDDYEDESND